MAIGRTGTVSFVLDADDSTVIVIEASTDLKTWTVLATATPQNGTVQVEDPDAANFPRRFYRLSQQRERKQ